MNDTLPSPQVHPPLPPPRRSNTPLFLIGCGTFVLLAVGGIVAATALGSRVTVDDRAVLRLALAGEIPEYVRGDGFDELFGKKPMTIRQHVLNLKKAAVDGHIKGVVLRLDPLAIGWAKVEELRDALVDFRKSGKFVIAYSEFLTEKEYALALGADQIIMPPDARFEFNGLAMDLAHYPGLLEKLGIEVQYFRFGKYKSASGQQFGLKAFTEPVKEMLNDELQGVFHTFIDAVAKARKLEPDALVALIAEAGEKAEWAKEHQLIDTIAYWDEVEALVREKAGLEADKKITWLSPTKYRDVDPVRAGLPKGKHSFALIYSVGLIVSGKGGGSSPFGGDTQGSTPLIKALRDATEDDDIDAIILRVDSPGGAGLGCDYVRREVEKARAKKPVIVSMSDVAASGGYWVSMDATAIVAQPSTYTGSIGIFSVVPSFGGLYEKMGLNNETFKVGEHADAIIGARTMSADEAKHFDTDLHASYQRFVALAAKGRGKTPEELEVVAQGRTWLGSQAVTNGLVDRLGGFDAAIELAKEKANIAADVPVQLKLFDKKKSVLQELLADDNDEETLSLSSAFADSVLKRTVEQSGTAPLVRRFPGLGAFAGQVLAGETTFPLMEHLPVIR